MQDLEQEYLRIALLYKNMLELLADYEGHFSDIDYSAIEDATAVLEDLEATLYVEKEKATERASMENYTKYVNDNKLTSSQLI